MAANISFGTPFGENQLRVRRTTQLGQLTDVIYDGDDGNLIIGEDAGTGLLDSVDGVILLGKQCGQAGADVKEEAIGIGLQAGALGIGESSVCIGRSAGHGVNAKNADDSVIIGARACSGLSGTYNDDCVVIGSDSGIGGTGASSICIGDTASAKGDRNISIGKNCNLNSASTQSICVGENAGRGTTTGTLQGNDFICIGNEVGQAPDIQSKSISIGSKEINAGFNNATSDEGIGYGSIAIGTSANGVADSDAKRGDLSVMIGGACAYNGIAGNSVAIGALAGTINPPAEGTVSIGFNAGAGTTASVKSKSVQIGDTANIAGSGTQSCAVGYNSNSEGDYSQAYGVNTLSSGISAIAIGAGARAVATGSIGIGGRYNGGSPYGELGTKSIVIGDGTALNGAVGEGAVVIGESCALSGAGGDNVIIGAFANSSTSTDNAICLNATGANLDAVASGLVIAPIINNGTVHAAGGSVKTPNPVNGFTHILYYNPTSGEIQAFAYA